MFVITYDNGSGYYEWACTPQPTAEAAWAASGLIGKTVAGAIPRLEQVISEGVKLQS